MATPLSATRLVAILKAEGMKVAQPYSKWASHERDAATGLTFGPVNGVMIHHTAGTSSRSLCYNGRPGLPGPLCHVHLAKDGTANMISAGRANHAGRVAVNAHNAVVSESKTHPKPSAASGTVDGNDKYYGIEVENLGNGKDPYPAVQYDATVRFAAAICRAHGWGEDSVIGHKEGSVEGKIDPSFDMDQFRRDVAQRLSGSASDGEKPPTTGGTVGSIYGVDVASYQSTTVPSTADKKTVSFVIVKATEGTSYVNPRMTAQVASARSKGMHVGLYHFVRGGSAKAQADYFLSKAQEKPGDSLWLDWEDGAFSATQKDEFIKYVKSKRPGYKVGLYCNQNFWLNKDTTSYAGDGLWIAQYGVTPGKPNITADWLIHQYSQDGGIDKNVARFSSKAAMKSWAAGSAAPEEEDPMAGMSDKDIADAVLNTDGVFGVPAHWRTDNPKNEEWKFSAVIVNLGDHVRNVEAQLAAQAVTLEKLVDAVGAAGDFDPELLKSEIREAIESVKINLTVSE